MTLQEYLVKLGWNIDEPSMKRFFGVLAATSAKTAELGATAVETAGAIELMVDRVARKYETLYYVSQRTGQSVRYIQSTQYAFKAIGLSAEDATASIESIGAALRTQPWLKAIFGNASNPTDVANRLGKSGLPYFLQARFAEMIGMDEKTLFHLQKFGAVEQAAQRDFARRQKEAGIDPQALANKSVAFSRALNLLESNLEIFGDRMAMDFIDPVTHGIERLSSIVEWLNKADVATNGWISTLATIGGSLGGITLLRKLLGRFLGGGAAATGAAGAEAGTAGEVAAGGLLGGLAFPLTAAGAAVYLGYLGSKKYGVFGDPKGAPLAGNQVDRAKQAADFFEKAGFPRSSAEGIASGLFSESGLNPNNRNPTSGAYGLAQWLTKSRKDAIEKRFGQKIEGSSFEDQLKFVLWELTQGNDPQALEAGKRLYQPGLTSKQGAGAFIHLFERPGASGELSDMSRAGPMADALARKSSINITNNTTVNVPPGADAHAAAKEFGKAQDLANANAIRNAQGALR